MRSNLVPVMMVLIVVAFVGAALYYWFGGGKSAQAVTGVVTDKMARAAGTEAGDKPLAQGLRVLTGQSLQRDVFYFIRVRTDKGDEVDIEVPRSFFQKVEVGDTIRQSSPDSTPTIIKSEIDERDAALSSVRLA